MKVKNRKALIYLMILLAMTFPLYVFALFFHHGFYRYYTPYYRPYYYTYGLPSWVYPTTNRVVIYPSTTTTTQYYYWSYGSPTTYTPGYDSGNYGNICYTNGSTIVCH